MVTSYTLERSSRSARCTSFQECDITSSNNPKPAYVPIPMRMDSITVCSQKSRVRAACELALHGLYVPTEELLPSIPWPLLLHENNDLRATVI